MARCKAKKRPWKAQRFAEQDGLCYWCRKRMVLVDCYTDDPRYATVEHMIPKSRGGRGGPLVLAHKWCNERREFMKWPHDPVFGALQTATAKPR